MRAGREPLRPVRVVGKDVADTFRDAGPVIRAYLRIKLRICPLLRAEAYLPDGGDVVDLGCGNGLWAAILKLGSPRRSVLGIDLDDRKIALARRILAGVPGLEFRRGDVGTAEIPPADICTIVDVLYLIPPEVQDRILRRCAESLRPGGILAVKDMDTNPRGKYLWNVIQETLAVKIIGFTLGSRFHFRPRAEVVSVLESLGLAVEVVRLDRGYAYPHILYLARKP